MKLITMEPTIETVESQNLELEEKSSASKIWSVRNIAILAVGLVFLVLAGAFYSVSSIDGGSSPSTSKPRINDPTDNRVKQMAIACEKGDSEAVLNLLKEGVDPNTTCVLHEKSVTPLIIVSNYGHLSIVKILINAGADVNLKNADGCSPLIIACDKGHENVVNELLKHKADANAATSNGEVPLQVACKIGNLKIVEQLLKHKANVNVKITASNQSTPLYIASDIGNVKIVEMLLDHKADVNAKIYSGSAPLHVASERNYFDVLVKLLEHKADVNAVDESNYTALHFACQDGHEEIVKKLLEFKADATKKLKQQSLTPFALAERNNQVKVIKALNAAGIEA
jgi:uncharacterized protein